MSMAGLGRLSSAERLMLAGLTPSMQATARAHRAAVLALGLPWTVVSGRRSFAQQTWLFEHRASSNVPVARPGYSRHELGEAFDIATASISVRDRARIGHLGEALGLTWGGRWQRPDPGHFEADSRQSAQGSRLTFLVAIAFLLS